MRLITEDEFLTNRELRDSVGDRLETLSLTKDTVLVPVFNVATTKMVAEYYGVHPRSVHQVMSVHRAELNSNGTHTLTGEAMDARPEFARDPYGFRKPIRLSNDQIVDIRGAGSIVHNEYAILRIGMLLRDSEVARELRKRLVALCQLRLEDGLSTGVPRDIVQFTESDITKIQGLRDSNVHRTDVLHETKFLQLIPNLHVATPQMVADFYEVDIDSVKKILATRKDELTQDGMYTLTRKKFKEEQFAPFVESHYGLVIPLDNNKEAFISNRGTNVLPERAVLRMGMLLKSSDIGREIRMRLLKGSSLVLASPQVNSVLQIGKGRTTSPVRRAIKDLVTTFCKGTKGHIGSVWNLIYKELATVHSIDLEARRLESGKARATRIEFLTDSEQLLVVSILVSMFKVNDIEAPDIANQLNVELPELQEFTIEKSLTLEELEHQYFFEREHEYLVSIGVTSWRDVKAYFNTLRN